MEKTADFFAAKKMEVDSEIQKEADIAYELAQKEPHGMSKAICQGIYLGLRKAQEIIAKVYNS